MSIRREQNHITDLATIESPLGFARTNGRLFVQQGSFQRYQVACGARGKDGSDGSSGADGGPGARGRDGISASKDKIKDQLLQEENENVFAAISGSSSDTSPPRPSGAMMSAAALGAGGRGENGGMGEAGKDGAPGQRGQDAKDIVATISIGMGVDNAVQLMLVPQDDLAQSFDLGDKNGFVAVCADGGDGGNGGRGGDGGSGGIGGDGGLGARGPTGPPAEGPGLPGGTGGPGYPGGDGGDGGRGGRGGNAGRGGSGGSGANIVLQSSDPCAFMCIVTRTKPGSPGKPGTPGNGGKGGRAGLKGLGGPGGYGGPGGRPAFKTLVLDDGTTQQMVLKTEGPQGALGPPGPAGEDGELGADSEMGQEAEEGSPGSPGSTLFKVTDPIGNVLESASSRYDLVMTHMSLSDQLGDDVYEPGEGIIVSKLVFRNKGGLGLPAGAIVRFPATKSINSTEEPVVLPAIPPGEEMEVPGTFDLRLPPSAVNPGPQPFRSKAAIFPLATLLGRQFCYASTVVELDVQYPLQLGDTCSEMPPCLVHESSCKVSVTVENISTAAYGMSFGKKSRAVVVRVLLPRQLCATNPAPTTTVKQEGVHTWLFIPVDLVEAKGTATVEFEVGMRHDAIPFDRCPVYVELILRGKSIQRREVTTRCSASFPPADQPPADVLLIASAMLTRQEYDFYCALFGSLSLSHDVWDTQLHHGISVDSRTSRRHKNTWIGRYRQRSIICSFGSPEELMMLHVDDLINHFLLPSVSMQSLVKLHSAAVVSEKLLKKEGIRVRPARPFTHGATDSNGDSWLSDFTDWTSGCVLVGVSREEVCEYASKWVSTEVTVNGSLFGGGHLTAPSEDDAKKKCKSLVSMLQSKDRMHVYFASRPYQYCPARKGMLHWYVYCLLRFDLRRYLQKQQLPSHRQCAACLLHRLREYGECKLARVPVNRFCHMLALPFGDRGYRPVYERQGGVRYNMRFPVGSRMCSLFVGLLCSMSVNRRVQLIAERHQCNFGFSYGQASDQEVPFMQLVTLTLYYDCKADLDCDNRTLPHFRALVAALQEFSSDIVTNQSSQQAFWFLYKKLHYHVTHMALPFSSKASVKTEVLKDLRDLRELFFGSRSDEKLNLTAQVAKYEAEMEIQDAAAAKKHVHFHTFLGELEYVLRPPIRRKEVKANPMTERQVQRAMEELSEQRAAAKEQFIKEVTDRIEAAANSAPARFERERERVKRREQLASQRRSERMMVMEEWEKRKASEAAERERLMLQVAERRRSIRLGLPKESVARDGWTRTNSSNEVRRRSARSMLLSRGGAEGDPLSQSDDSAQRLSKANSWTSVRTRQKRPGSIQLTKRSGSEPRPDRDYGHRVGHLAHESAGVAAEMEVKRKERQDAVAVVADSAAEAEHTSYCDTVPLDGADEGSASAEDAAEDIVKGDTLEEGDDAIGAQEANGVGSEDERPGVGMGDSSFDIEQSDGKPLETGGRDSGSEVISTALGTVTSAPVQPKEDSSAPEPQEKPSETSAREVEEKERTVSEEQECAASSSAVNEELIPVGVASDEGDGATTQSAANVGDGESDCEDGSTSDALPKLDGDASLSVKGGDGSGVLVTGGSYPSEEERVAGFGESVDGESPHSVSTEHERDSEQQAPIAVLEGETADSCGDGESSSEKDHCEDGASSDHFTEGECSTAPSTSKVPLSPSIVVSEADDTEVDFASFVDAANEFLRGDTELESTKRDSVDLDCQSNDTTEHEEDDMSSSDSDDEFLAQLTDDDDEAEEDKVERYADEASCSVEADDGEADSRLPECSSASSVEEGEGESGQDEWMRLLVSQEMSVEDADDDVLQYDQ